MIPPLFSPEPWPDEWRGVLDDAALRRAAGDAALARGSELAARGAVDVLGEDPLPEPALRAWVTDDGADCSAETWIENDAVAGRCNCPPAAAGRFCEHQVAVAVAWREHRAGRSVFPPRAWRGDRDDVGADDADELAALRDFLRRQPASALAGQLLDLAAFDDGIARRLQRWQERSEAGSDPVRIRRQIDELLPLDAGNPDWDDDLYGTVDAEELRDLLRQARACHAQGALDLSHYALRRAWQWQQQGLDDGEDSGELCEELGEEWLLCLRAAGPQPKAFGEVYLDLLLDDPLDCIDTEAAEAAMGDEALAGYRQAVARRWRAAKDTAKVLAGAPPGSSAAALRASMPSQDLFTLEQLHLEQLEAAGEIDAALALLREDLGSAYAHNRLIAFLERQGRHGEALAQAEAAHKQFPDDWTLQQALLHGYEQAGRMQEALALRRLRFDQRPGVQLYLDVLQAARAAGRDASALREELLAALAAREEEAAQRPRPKTSMSVYGWAPSGVRDVTLRADILAEEGRWDEACALVQPPAWCEARTLRRIALHLGPERHADAVVLLQSLLEDAMVRASSPYEQELALVREAAQRMDPAPRAAWLSGLRLRYKPKRNFIKGLPSG